MIRLTREQVRQIDRRSIQEFGIPGIVLMENAARAVADAAWDMIGRRPAPVLILCGGGNNGGDGLAAARHLHNRGVPVQIALITDPGDYDGDALANWRIVQAMKLPWTAVEPSRIASLSPALIIDAIFGTGLTRPPRDPFAQIADAVNRSDLPVLSVDLPSGLDCDTGQPPGACIRATATVTFVAEKAGFANPASRVFTGDIQVADIGCPRELIGGIPYPSSMT